MWRTRSVRHSFLGFVFNYVRLLITVDHAELSRFSPNLPLIHLNVVHDRGIQSKITSDLVTILRTFFNACINYPV